MGLKPIFNPTFLQYGSSSFFPLPSSFVNQASNFMSHREQFIWKRGIEISVICYQLTQNFPKAELYGLTSQIRRAAVSVPSNIAEGYGRTSNNEYIRFLQIALGSLRELDTQLIIARRVGLAAESELFSKAMKEVDEMQRIIVTTLNKLKTSPNLS
jgi:four helix bundle protein